MYYIVEPMAEGDIEAVQAIERRSFATPWSAQTYRQELRSPITRYLVARAATKLPPPRSERKPQPLGMFTRFMAMFHRPAPVPVREPVSPIIGYGGVWLSVDDGHITTLALAPEYRGRGIGELLLNGLIDQASLLGAEQLTLEVRVSNTVAQQLYLKYGFRPVGTRPRYYTDNSEDALLMTTDPIRTPAYQEQLKRLREQLYARLRSAADEVGSTTWTLQDRIAG